MKDNPRNAQTTGTLRLVDCAVASAAAPTYFAPWTIQIGDRAVVLVDGGVGVTGNPVYQACVEAFYYDDFTPDDTRVVSLGTGYFPSGDRHAERPVRLARVDRRARCWTRPRSSKPTL